jgi:hypothetical protein
VNGWLDGILPNLSSLPPEFLGGGRG